MILMYVVLVGCFKVDQVLVKQCSAFLEVMS
jgi:hypothetical protein